MKLSQIPGLAGDIARTRFVRSACYAPVLETVCGVKVLPLTLWHVVMLEVIESPFIVGGTIIPDDVSILLWIVSPKYSRSSFGRWRFLRQCRRNITYPVPHGPHPPDFNPSRYIFQRMIGEIEDYISEAHSDLPASNARGISLPFRSLASAVIDRLATEYGWSESDIMNLPLKRIAQYLNSIEHRNGGVVFNGSEKARQSWLDSHQPARN